MNSEEEPMMAIDLSTLFGCTSDCKSVADIVVYITTNTIDDKKRIDAAALGMILTTFQNCHDGTSRDDALDALDNLSLTKQKIDRASCHQPEVIRVTSEILLSTQIYVDEMTIPCTEWPTTKEIAEHVLKQACRYGITT
jgi:hypothetical protein